jgi:uncharacterized protein (TIGR02246 family)
MQRHSLIELAMERAARNANNAEPAIALDPEPAVALDSEPAVAFASEPAIAPATDRHDAGEHLETPTTADRPPPLPALHDRRGGAYSGRAVVLSGLLSAAVASALTWLATGTADRGEFAAHETSAASAPAASLPAAVPPPAAPAAAVPTAKPAKPGEAQARALIERWRQAWASRDVDAYLGCYGADFQPIDGQSRSAWAAARRKRLSTPSEIDLQVREIRFEHITPDRLRAVFLQDYASGSYRETARPKTLLLSQQDGDWRIVGEWQDATPALAAGTR